MNADEIRRYLHESLNARDSGEEHAAMALRLLLELRGDGIQVYDVSVRPNFTDIEVEFEDGARVCASEYGRALAIRPQKGPTIFVLLLILIVIDVLFSVIVGTTAGLEAGAAVGAALLIVIGLMCWRINRLKWSPN